MAEEIPKHYERDHRKDCTPWETSLSISSRRTAFRMNASTTWSRIGKLAILQIIRSPLKGYGGRFREASGSAKTKESSSDCQAIVKRMKGVMQNDTNGLGYSFSALDAVRYLHRRHRKRRRE